MSKAFLSKTIEYIKPIKIVRPLNCLFSFVCVVFGALVAGSSFFSIDNIFIALSATLIAGAGYVINDIFDIGIDIINKPERILPSGLLSIKQAQYLGVILGLVGIILSLLSLNRWHLIIASVNLFLLVLYAAYLKKNGLLGNLVVSWAASSTFLFGALLGQNIKRALPIMVFAFLYTLIREWTKTIEDYEGDLSEGAKTIAISLGKQKTSFLIVIPSVLLVLCIFVFYLFGMCNRFEFVMLNILVAIPLALFNIVLIRSQHKEIVNEIHRWMKIDMFVLLLIFGTSLILELKGLI
ncbi:MAG: geranylgeranylglycerol-phosphate geranylgeranyltransferase [Candidatus Cloacimonadales bacterium]|jgi:geranylgeranylglycerol-phosphate geranylgeranyltransferase|nr:geranylgeranylglycerol-phosphate geranylgeranyltransferase [Candidatus Cloacimonadota bacterium]MDD2651106.1 geranylgeranylglycerol-phosphate geranylgeranyltransferase [Candidatus Cloacimonadota bacterium]MDD3501240.1 geranylgeranylglycerol-phosphate geranylgeranyltransferase [Candidatus Cloacimonadota bacterium]MDX9977534.1 geranylgeranylglycerol-phosphate geranylgeranyltransferase [Candidatus Cloacimonadales bacterium]